MKKAIGTLGLAMRAHKIATGETIFKKLRSKAIMADDMEKKRKKKLTDKCAYYHVPYVLANGGN